MKRISMLQTLALLLFMIAASFPAKTQWLYKKPLHRGRAFFATEVVDEKIYVIGGAVSRTESTASMEVYDYNTDTWDTTKASMPVALCAAGSAVYDGKIYVIGGKPTFEGNIWLNTVYEYNPSTDKWTPIPYTLLTPRAFLSACTLGTEIYAIGGRTATVFSIFAVEKLDFADLSKGWASFDGLNAGRSNFTAENLHGILYAMGGVDAVNPTSVEKYNPATSAVWVKTGEYFDRYLHGSTAWGGNIYMFGGLTTNNPAPLPDLVRYNPTRGFDTLPGTLPEIKAACGAAVVDSHLFAIGGAQVPFFLPAEPGSPISASVLMYGTTLVSIKEKRAASDFVLLEQNQPNPFSAQTTIRYEMKRPAEIRIQVYDLNGQEVATLWEGRQTAGTHFVTWNAVGVPEGVYFFQLQSNESTATRKCILINH
ncbi:MAG: T9SS type A sorting domain-containing protein [Thermoanaerobaculia bacterium]|nr:T9SS type A sorting domain-containing protein [Thermoanaerobaculia bacterium]